MSQQNYTINIPANGCFNDNSNFAALTILKATQAFTVAFNGGPGLPASAGLSYTPPGGSRNACFSNPNATAITVTYAIGDEVAKYTAADASASGASVYAVGNCGAANGTVIALPDVSGAVDNITVNPNGYMEFLDNQTVKISGTNNGNRRQMITFCISSAAVSAFGLLVMDSNGCAMLNIPAGSPPQAYPFDGDIYVQGIGGTAFVTIGQFFLKNN